MHFNLGEVLLIHFIVFDSSFFQRHEGKQNYGTNKIRKWIFL